MAMMQSPEILDLVVRAGSGEQISQAELITAMAKDPVVMGSFARAMVKSGRLSFNPTERKRLPRRRAPSPQKNTRNGNADNANEQAVNPSRR